MSTEVQKPKPWPTCDLCSEPTEAYADARIPGQGWANVCNDHFFTHGCYLGTGHGQKFILPKEPSPQEEPSEEQLEEWAMDSVCEATDGCIVEHDGTCPHGCKSWFLELGLI